MSSAHRTRVMVVDDHPVMRDGLRDALEASGRFEVVGLAEDGEEAVRTVEGLRPEVIVMDVMMPVKDGIEACREIMELPARHAGADADGLQRGGCGDRGGRCRGDGLPSEVLAVEGTGGSCRGRGRRPVANT